MQIVGEPGYGATSHTHRRNSDSRLTMQSSADSERRLAESDGSAGEPSERLDSEGDIGLTLPSFARTPTKASSCPVVTVITGQDLDWLDAAEKYPCGPAHPLAIGRACASTSPMQSMMLARPASARGALLLPFPIMVDGDAGGPWRRMLEADEYPGVGLLCLRPAQSLSLPGALAFVRSTRRPGAVPSFCLLRAALWLLGRVFGLRASLFALTWRRTPTRSATDASHLHSAKIEEQVISSAAAYAPPILYRRRCLSSLGRRTTSRVQKGDRSRQDVVTCSVTGTSRHQARARFSKHQHTIVVVFDVVRGSGEEARTCTASSWGSDGSARRQQHVGHTLTTLSQPSAPPSLPIRDWSLPRSTKARVAEDSAWQLAQER